MIFIEIKLFKTLILSDFLSQDGICETFVLEDSQI